MMIGSFNLDALAMALLTIFGASLMICAIALWAIFCAHMFRNYVAAIFTAALPAFLAALTALYLFYAGIIA